MSRRRERFFMSDAEARVQAALLRDPFDPFEIAQRQARAIESAHDGRVCVDVVPKFYFVGGERRVRYELRSNTLGGLPQ